MPEPGRVLTRQEVEAQVVDACTVALSEFSREALRRAMHEAREVSPDSWLPTMLADYLDAGYGWNESDGAVLSAGEEKQP